jgi:hypothetical protein
MRASQWLGMKTPIQRMMIFRLTCWTEGEVGHTGVGTIIGKAINNSIAWATLSTVNKGVTIAASLGIVHFP